MESTYFSFVRWQYLLILGLFVPAISAAPKSKDEITHDDRFFHGDIYYQLYDERKRGVDGRLLGEGFQNRTYSRKEILIIAEKRFKSYFFEVAGQLEQTTGDKLGLTLKDVSGAMAMGLFVPHIEDLKLVHEALGKPALHEIPEPYRSDSEYFREPFYAKWRDQQWNEAYGSLKEITSITKKINYTNAPPGKIRMIVANQWIYMSPEDVGLRIHIRSNSNYFSGHFEGLLKPDHNLRYETAKEILLKADRSDLLDKLNAYINGGQWTDRWGRVSSADGSLGTSSIYSYWATGSDTYSDFNFYHDRKLTRSTFHNNQIDRIWNYHVERRKRAAEKERLEKLEEEKRQLAKRGVEKEHILAVQRELMLIDKNSEVTLSGFWDPPTKNASKVLIVALQLHEADHSSWTGGYNGTYSPAFAKHLRSRLSNIKSIQGAALEEGSLERFVNGMDKLIESGVPVTGSSLQRNVPSY